MHKKIAAVVVTYNRKESLLKNISCLLKQSNYVNRIYIIDNASTDGTKRYIDEVLRNNGNIEYTYINENIGGAGGFYTGIKMAYDDGYDYIWSMDDDAFPFQTALEKLMEIKNSINEEICLWSNSDKDKDFNGVIKETHYFTFVGLFVSRYIIEKIGMPRKEFFIYHDDEEYAYRIVNSGYKILKVKESIIEHTDFKRREEYCGTFLLWKFYFPRMSDWRLYYYVRNSILMYKITDKNKYKQIFKTMPLVFIKIIALKIPQIKIFLKGYFHGILGISGKQVSP